MLFPELCVNFGFFSCGFCLGLIGNFVFFFVVVVLEHLYDAFFRRSFLRGPIGIGLRLMGLRPGAALGAARATLVASLPELDPAGRSPHHDVTYVGPVVMASPPVPGPPAVLVSLSTFAYPGMASCLQRLLDATAGALRPQ